MRFIRKTGDPAFRQDVLLTAHFLRVVSKHPEVAAPLAGLVDELLRYVQALVDAGLVHEVVVDDLAGGLLWEVLSNKERNAGLVVALNKLTDGGAA